MGEREIGSLLKRKCESLSLTVWFITRVPVSAPVCLYLFIILYIHKYLCFSLCICVIILPAYLRLWWGKPGRQWSSVWLHSRGKRGMRRDESVALAAWLFCTSEHEHTMPGQRVNIGWLCEKRTASTYSQSWRKTGGLEATLLLENRSEWKCTNARFAAV